MSVYGTNEVSIGGERMLIVGGGAAHLARLARDGDQSRPAVSDWRFERGEPWQWSYDLNALRRSEWYERTLCGRYWQEMKPSDGPLISEFDSHVFAPDCRSCLRIMSKVLTSTVPDARVAFVSSLAVEKVVASGSAQVSGVPGDQVETLRAAVRRNLRARGLRGNTYCQGGEVFVVSEDAWNRLPEATRASFDRKVAQIMEDALDGAATPTPGADDCLIDWGLWGEGTG